MEQRTKARELRNNATLAERVLWRAISARKLGARFNRQVPIGPFICDFVSRGARLIVEVDGGQHADSNDDAARTRLLEMQGYRVIRFWNNEVLGNLDGVVMKIERVLGESPSPSPSRTREGSGGGERAASSLPSRLRQRSGEELVGAP